MNGALWTAGEIAAALGVGASSAFPMATGVSIDSRTLTPGDLFIAIRGEASDGHDYVASAFLAGAIACVIAADRAANLSLLGPVFAVDDPLRAMERLGIAARAHTKAKIVAVTGSVGKTSAKEMLRVALSVAGQTHASIASYNNHWGVPLTLARMPRETQFGVFEIGMNHAGEITPLVAMVRPDVAIVTTIAPVHIEYLGSLRGIAQAKAEIFSGVTKGGAAILNRDAPQFELLDEAARARGLRVETFGRAADADARLTSCEPSGEGSRITLALNGREVAFDLGAPGRHMAQNAAGVLLAARAAGVAIDLAAPALRRFEPPRGRGQRFTLAAPDGALTLIDESYNANPASMRAALDLLGAARPGPGGRRIAVLGDMLELGERGAALHAELADDVARNKVDLLFCAGPLMRALYGVAPAAHRGAWGARSADIEAQVLDAVHAGDVIVVKGSNGSRMGPIVAALKARLPEAVAKD